MKKKSIVSKISLPRREDVEKPLTIEEAKRISKLTYEERLLELKELILPELKRITSCWIFGMLILKEEASVKTL